MSEVDIQIHHHGGEVFVQGGDQARQPGERDGLGDPEAHPARERVAVPDPFLGLATQCQDALRVIDEGPSLRRYPRRPPFALEELHAEGALQLPHAHGHRRLGGLELAGGGAEAPQADDPGEGFQVPDVHGDRTLNGYLWNNIRNYNLR